MQEGVNQEDAYIEHAPRNIDPISPGQMMNVLINRTSGWSMTRDFIGCKETGDTANTSHEETLISSRRYHDDRPDGTCAAMTKFIPKRLDCNTRG